MFKIKELKRTCIACPTQYEGILDNGHSIYIRYRWGKLSIRISYGKSSNVNDAVKGHEVFTATLGGSLDGVLDDDELLRVCSNVIEFPKEIKHVG